MNFSVNLRHDIRMNHFAGLSNDPASKDNKTHADSESSTRSWSFLVPEMRKLMLREVTVYFTQWSTGTLESLVLNSRIYAFIKPKSQTLKILRKIQTLKNSFLWPFESVEESMPLYFYMDMEYSFY